MPASASPSATLLRTARTSISWLTGVAATPALLSASTAYLPAGTVGAASTRTTSGRARSASPATFFGFPGATAIWSRLLANSWGAPSDMPAFVTFAMLSSSADAKTSAGAPLTIWVASVDDDPKLNVKWADGSVFRKSPPSWLNASVSDEPAKTVTSARGWAAFGPADEHAPTTTRAAVAAVATRIRTCYD